MEVYYVELRKATVLEKKFIYSMCWLFGMELQFGAHIRQHPPHPYPKHHHHHPSQSHPTHHPMPGLVHKHLGDFQKAMFAGCKKNNKMLLLVSSILTLEHRPHH